MPDISGSIIELYDRISPPRRACVPSFSFKTRSILFFLFLFLFPSPRSYVIAIIEIDNILPRLTSCLFDFKPSIIIRNSQFDALFSRMTFLFPSFSRHDAESIPSCSSPFSLASSEIDAHPRSLVIRKIRFFLYFSLSLPRTPSRSLLFPSPSPLSLFPHYPIYRSSKLIVLSSSSNFLLSIAISL